MEINEFLARLQGVRRNASGWQALCPGHEDRRQSLSVAEADGKILLRCFAGCRTEDIVAALGLTMADLFVDGHKPLKVAPSPKPLVAPITKADRKPLDWLAGHCQVPVDFLRSLPLVADGNRIGFSSPNGPTKWRQVGSKAFTWEPPGSPAPPLWPVPEPSLPSTIWLTEGETDCIVARYIGLDAFSLTRGAGTPLTVEQAQALKARGAGVAFIAFDADEAGRQGAQRLAAVLSAAGLEVGTVDLAASGLCDPLLGQKDLRDAWLSLRDANTLRQRLEFALLPPIEEVVVATKNHFIAADNLAATSGESGVDWLPLLQVEGLVGRGLCTLLSSRPKAGKTTLAAHAAKQWLTQGLRIAWCTEEPRGLWRQRIGHLGLASNNLLLAFADGAEPQIWCERLKGIEPDVIVIDTARAFLGIGDENDAAIVHNCLFPIIQTARKLDAALVVLHHRRKVDGDEGTDHAGSHAFVGECDVAISLQQDTDRRRQLVVRSRFEESPDKLLIELDTEGHYRALGRPDDVALEEVKERVREVLTEEWQTTGQILEAFGEPKPGRENVRRALHELQRSGVIERMAGRGRIADQWRFVATTTPSYSGSNTNGARL